MSEIREDLLAVLAAPTARDKQKRIGPSALGDRCDRCLLKALRGESDPLPAGFLATWIGTAVHSYVADLFTAPYADDRWIVETKVTVGERPHLGVVKGTADLFDTETGTLIDWKVMTHKGANRLAKGMIPFGQRVVFTADYAGSTAAKYVTQLSLYVVGLRERGLDVRSAALAVIPKDKSGATLAEDMNLLEIPIMPDLAEAALDRAENLLETYGSEGDLPDPGAFCYNCNPPNRRSTK